MKVVLVTIGFAICLLFELPALIKQEKKNMILYSLFMVIAFSETILIVSLKNLPSFASIIESIFRPIVKKIFGS